MVRLAAPVRLLCICHRTIGTRCSAHFILHKIALLSIALYFDALCTIIAYFLLILPRADFLSAMWFLISNIENRFFVVEKLEERFNMEFFVLKKKVRWENKAIIQIIQIHQVYSWKPHCTRHSQFWLKFNTAYFQDDEDCNGWKSFWEFHQNLNI